MTSISFSFCVFRWLLHIYWYEFFEQRKKYLRGTGFVIGSYCYRTQDKIPFMAKLNETLYWSILCNFLTVTLFLDKCFLVICMNMLTCVHFILNQYIVSSHRNH